MAKGSNAGAFIVLAILALGGLGLSGYMFINDRFFGGDEPLPDNDQIIAVWNKLTESGSNSNFYLNLSENQLNQSEYFILTGGTNLTLNHPGWYRITIRTIWSSLSSATNYVFNVEKNGATSDSLVYLSAPQETYYTINLFDYVYSDGNDYFQFNCYNGAADAFSIASNQNYNQFILEFIE
jgi:hypothetical protein